MHNFIKYENINYFIAPDRDVICSICGIKGYYSYQGTHIIILCENNGFTDDMLYSELEKLTCEEFLIKKIVE
jgi:hypothetical protein